jgi:hypothetical protein
MDYVYLSPNQKLELKQLTRQRVEQNFSIEYVSQQYVAAWRQSA